MLEGPNDIWMRPWVGNNYPTRRLLIVGESAYHDPISSYCVNLRTNIDIVEDEIEGRCTHKAQRQIAKIVCNAAQPDYEGFWNSVSFYNFVQGPLSSRSSREQIGSLLPRSKVAFAELIGLTNAPQAETNPCCCRWNNGDMGSDASCSLHGSGLGVRATRV
jgi:hypothetical protein